MLFAVIQYNVITDEQIVLKDELELDDARLVEHEWYESAARKPHLTVDIEEME